MPDRRPTLQEQIDDLMRRFDAVNDLYIRKIAAQILTIGELNATSMDRIRIMAQMNADIMEINARLAAAAQMAVPDLMKIYESALTDLYYDERFERALKDTPLSREAKHRLERLAQTVGRQSAQTMQNLSNTTIASQQYRRIVDRAVLAVTTGLGDYKSAVRDGIREVGYNGLQMQYPSGYRRRLDTAIRQNIIDGAKQIAQQGSDMMSEELGYDAVEISVHLMPAPDHAPVQGHIFLREEFEKLQSEQPFEDINGNRFEPIRRQIGQWNCMHIAMGFSTMYGRPKYSQEQLDGILARNSEGCMIGGRRYTMYEASQLMRKIETQVRREMDTAVAAAKVDDMELRQQCQKRINALNARYKQVTDASGLRPHRDRMRVEGFRRVKV